jgi:group I intron endonuclease
MFVYRTTNLINGKFYIGQHSTNDLTDGYKGSGLLIRKAFKKHGKENFKFDVIEFSDSREYLDKLEKNLIKAEEALNNEIGYNIHQGGLGGSSYKKINQYKLNGSYIRTWDAIIIASQELNLSYKTIQNCVKGYKPSCGGYMWKDYFENAECADIQEFEDKSVKRVNQYSLEGKFIKMWFSITEAALVLNLNSSSVGKCCRKEISTHQTGGFIWRCTHDETGISDILPVVYKVKKKVDQFTLDGSYLKSFDSISSAAKNKWFSSNISKCCNGKENRLKGVFEYKKLNIITLAQRTEIY